MELLNFSVGQVQTVRIGQDDVKTGYVKGPVAEPWIITDEGAEGDRRASHPDKIYAFARTGYDYWREHFGLEPGCWPDGFFGENLTLDVLDEDALRVGDVFTLGEEVRLFVAGARNPCIKLAWRMGQPRTFQRTFALSRHTGAYFGVERAGRVRPGDRLERVSGDPAMPSVTDVCDMMQGHDAPRLEPLKRLLAYDRLSQVNRLLLGSKLDAAERAGAFAAGRWRGWRPFTLQRVVEEAPGIRSFHLAPDDGAGICAPKPGQFVTVRMRGEDGAEIVRPWSLSSFSYEPSDYRLTVRRQGGAGSNWLHDASLGDRVELKAPSGCFAIDMGGFRPVALVAVGIGITPLFAMLQAQLTRPDAAPVFLIYGARTPGDVALRAEIEAMAAERPNVHVSYVYSRSDAAGPPSRITAEVVLERLKPLYIDLHGRRVDLPWFEADMYICGPDDFCETLKADLVAHGGNGDHIRYETFSAIVAEAAEVDAAAVHFARSGVRVEWTAEGGASLLELAEAAGLEVANDCRAGACLTCRTRVIAGATTADLPDGCTLVCIARPKTAELELEL